MENESRLQALANRFNKEEFKILNEEMTFSEYLDRAHQNPRLIRSAYQRLYDMIVSKGSNKFKRYRKTYTHYSFFDNVDIPIFGLEETLEQLVKFIKGAAGGYGASRASRTSRCSASSISVKGSLTRSMTYPVRLTAPINGCLSSSLSCRSGVPSSAARVLGT